jgi:hypothetical protein
MDVLTNLAQEAKIYDVAAKNSFEFPSSAAVTVCAHTSKKVFPSKDLLSIQFEEKNCLLLLLPKLTSTVVESKGDFFSIL